MEKRTLLLLIAGLVVLGIAGRLLPHLPNATPLTALVFAGALFFSKRASLLVPLCALALSDLIIGLYDWRLMASVYGSFALIAGFSWLTRKRPGILTVGYSVIASSIIFYLITNAAVWWFSPWYPKTFAGLLYSYELGLPFLRNMLIGDLIYTPLVLGALYLACNRRHIAAVNSLFARAEGQSISQTP